MSHPFSSDTPGPLTADHATAEPTALSAFTPTTPATADSRRNLLKAAGLVALVGGGGAALAACSASTSTRSSSTAQSSSSASPSAPSSSAPTPSASAPSSAPSATTTKASARPSKSAKAPSGPSVTKAEVPVGGGFIMPNADYVVTQPDKGSYKAFSKICTHQGCPVSQITNSEIICRCHGSHFSIKDGSVLNGPAKTSLPEAKTTVSGDKIVITT